MPAFCAKMPVESFVTIAIYSVPLHQQIVKLQQNRRKTYEESITKVLSDMHKMNQEMILQYLCIINL